MSIIYAMYAPTPKKGLFNVQSAGSDSLARHHNTTHVDPATQTVCLRPAERQRVARACKRCSTSKIKCDGKSPCGKCSKSNSHCFYEEPKKRKSKAHLGSEQPAKRLAQGEDISNDGLMTSHVSEIQENLAIQPRSVLSALPLERNTEEHSSLTSSIRPTSQSQPQINHAAGYSKGVPRSSNFGAFGSSDIAGFQTDFDDLGWMTGSLDPYLWPISFDLGQDFDILHNAGISEPQARQRNAPAAADERLGLPPTPASDIDDLYDRSHSPVLDKDAVDVRQYRPTSIEVDAPLHFPDVDPASLLDAEWENFAHVDPLSNKTMDAITHLAEEMRREPHHAPFTNLQLPPHPILNAWVQLYFECFHPVFPILHKPTFSLPEIDPLLVLAVASIGAQFSALKNAKAFARSMRELVRRRSSSQCEKQNQVSRTVWMTQVIMLTNLAMSHSGDRRELEVAEVLQAVPVTLARRKGVLEDILPHERIAKLRLPLEQTWRLWAVDEERRRVGFAVWLVDFTYRAHFNLTSLMDPCELRNTLPQTEDKWEAINAESWAQVPYSLESGRTQNLGDTSLNSTWLSVWSKTGTLGKQVILAALMEQARAQHPSCCHKSVTSSSSTPARQALESIMAIMDAQQGEPSLQDVKTSHTHKVMCLTALMTCHAPATDLTVTALRQIYHRLDDRELSSIAQQWRVCPAQGRTTVHYAARVLDTIRTNHAAAHYAMPVCLLKAALTLWLYARVFGNSAPTESSTSSSSAPSSTNPHNAVLDERAPAGGRDRIHLPSITDLPSLHGRRKLLSDSIAAMGSLQVWGVSSVYLHLLQRLEASEDATEEED